MWYFKKKEEMHKEFDKKKQILNVLTNYFCGGLRKMEEGE